jgi:predicted glycoside hydrolase/deacetylase ChbG (UPF0249 family)
VRVVLNGDDFGWSPDTVRATIDCLEHGLLTSATIMPNMPATAEAIAYAHSRPEFSFGVHLCLTGDGTERPLCDPSAVPGLVDGEGLLLNTREARLRALVARLPVDQLEQEITAQISFVLEHGVPVSHVDSHRHLHKFRPIREALARTLPRFGLVRVRNVQDVYLRRPLRSPTYWLGRRWRRAIMAAYVTTDHFYMPTSAADTSWDVLATRLTQFSPSATIEIGVHPGYAESWRSRERDGLEAFVTRARRAHRFLGWKEIGAGQQR